MTLKGKNNILFLGMWLFYAFLPMSAFSGKIQKPVYDTQTFCKMFGCFVLHGSRTAESADTSFRIRKGVGFLEIYRKVRHNHHLRDTLAGERQQYMRPCNRNQRPWCSWLDAGFLLWQARFLRIWQQNIRPAALLLNRYFPFRMLYKGHSLLLFYFPLSASLLFLFPYSIIVYDISHTYVF